MAFSHRNALAQTLRSLHIPGSPLLLTNIYSPDTAKTVLSHPSTKAIATASFAIAAISGLSDATLDFETNLTAIRKIAAVVEADGRNIPLTADLQDGYEDIAENITSVIAAGAVGANLEDENHAQGGGLRDLEDAVQRIRSAVQAAKALGVPDFVINARTDVLVYGGTISDAIERGKAFLEAGATTVFVWGGPKGRGVRDAEVRQLVEGLGGMVNVKMNLRPGFLKAKEIAELGVARISIGPELYYKASEGFRAGLEEAVGRG